MSVCLLTNRGHVGPAKASLTRLLEIPFVRAFLVGRTRRHRVGWKERAQVAGVYAKESCSLVKLISDLLSACVATAVMVLECDQVCSVHS